MNIDNMPTSLFHYTTVSGLLGIIQSSSLWATDVRFMNDEQEGTYAQQLLMAALKGLPGPLLESLGEDAATTYQRFFDLTLREINSEKFGLYATCFCEDGDLLSQWRGYGSDHGYAIEFATRALAGTAAELNVYAPASGIFQVGYGTSSVDRIVSEAQALLKDFNLNHAGVKAHYAALHLSSLLTTVKHPAFSEEKEWRRLVATEGLWDVRRPEFEAKLHFRATPMAIVPYLNLQLPKSAIRGIRVGPGPNTELRKQGVTRLLGAFGVSVEVSSSGVPLRS